jgi:hypothetical protein
VYPVQIPDPGVQPANQHIRDWFVPELAPEDAGDPFPFFNHMDPALAAAGRLLKNETGTVLTGRKRGMEKGQEYHDNKDDGPSKQRPCRRSPKSSSAILTPTFCSAVLVRVSRLQ